MTNYEKYKDMFIKIISDNIGVNKYTNVPCDCSQMDCEDCIADNNNGCGCIFIDWLNAEYIEPPKDHIEISTLIAYLKQEPNQLKHVKSIKIVDGMPVINGD